MAGKNVIFGSKKPKSDRLLGFFITLNLNGLKLTEKVSSLRMSFRLWKNTIASAWFFDLSTARNRHFGLKRGSAHPYHSLWSSSLPALDFGMRTIL